MPEKLATAPSANVTTIKRAVSRGIPLQRAKPQQQRVVPLTGDVAPILQAHAKQQIDDEAKGLETELVFESVPGKIGQWIGPQVMRRSLNTMMLAEGVDRITLRAIMGHTSEPMTEQYAGIGDAAKADAIRRIRPRLAQSAQDVN